jgi:hypothetical protein
MCEPFLRRPNPQVREWTDLKKGVGSWRWGESNPRASTSPRKHLRAQPAIWISESPRAPARSVPPSPVSVPLGTRTLPRGEPASDARPGIAGVSRLTATYF